MKILLVTRRGIFRGDPGEYFKPEYNGVKTEPCLAGMFGWYWYKALCELGHEVEPFIFYKGPFLDSFREFNLFIDRLKGRFSVTKKISQRETNKSLLFKTLVYKPELILIDAGESIYPDTLIEIKQRTKAKIAIWLLDDPEVQNWNNVLNCLSVYDFLYVFDPDYVSRFKGMGVKSYIEYLPCATDPDVYKTYAISKEEQDEFNCQLSFVGNITDKRAALFKELKEFDLGIWSWNPWRLKGDVFLRNSYRGVAWGQKASKIFNASKIVLNSHHPQTLSGVNMKTFEIASSGGFQLVDRTKDLDNLFKNGSEIICYKNNAELKELIGYYLTHDMQRQEISKRAQQRACAEHTYKHRLKRLISQVEGLR